MTAPVHVIANCAAAGGRAGRLLPRLEDALRAAGIEHRVDRTRGPGHAWEIAGAARDGAFPRLLIVGGDGTVHEVANGLLDGGRHGDPPPFAVLPVGTGNDFYRMARRGPGIPGVLEVLRRGVPRAFDVGTVAWDGDRRHFVNLLGVGVDVEVLRRRTRFRRLPGMVQYLGALLSALLAYRPIPLHLTLEPDGRDPFVIESATLLSAVTVGPYVAGGLLLSPEARPDDGLLDVFLVEKVGLLKVARYLPSVLRGNAARHPEVHADQVPRLRIRSPTGDPFPFELDGEVMDGETTCLDVGLRTRCLPVLELPSEAGA